MTNEELLRKKIDASGYRMGFVAERLGLSRAGLYLKLTNVNDFTATEIQGLCDLLNINALEERNEIFFAQKVDG